MTRLARLLTVLGIGGAVFGLSKFHASRVAEPAYDFTASSRFVWALAYIGLLLIGAYGVGLPDLTRSRRSIVLASTSATAAGALGISVLQLVLGTALLPRFVILGTAMLAVPWLWICANLATDGRSRELERDRVIVIGSWADAAELTMQLDEAAERPALVVDVVAPADLHPMSLTDRPLKRAVEEGQATVVVLDREAQNNPIVIPQVAELHEVGIRVRTLSLFYEEWLGKLPVAELERVSLLFDIGEIHRSRYARRRRLVDLVLAALGAIPFLAALPVVMLGNALGNRGPLFFKQERVGKGGELFSIYKFRTMVDGGDSTTWTADNDPRITPFGKFLRLSHIDELPQVWNIAKGDLAFVGPRPEQAHYVEELSDKLPFYRLRHLVRPGMTGWAQVKFGYAGDQSDALEKLQYEFYYLRHQSMVFDLRIIARTLRSVLGRKGR